MKNKPSFKMLMSHEEETIKLNVTLVFKSNVVHLTGGIAYKTMVICKRNLFFCGTKKHSLGGRVPRDTIFMLHTAHVILSLDMSEKPGLQIRVEEKERSSGDAIREIGSRVHAFRQETK
jgi:hypothetical protein